MRHPPAIPFRRIAKRDVYIADYTINGHRVYYSVDSRGELAGLRTVAPDADPEPKIAELWTILDHDDPITPPHSHQPISPNA